MSEPKAQLVDPQENMNLPGMNATGVITASSFSGEGGVVTGLTGSPNLNVGVVTATSFVGDGTGHAANLTGTPNLNLGLTTATSFIGDAVGKAAGLRGTPNLNVGLITATSFAGAVTGDVTGNITGLAVSVTPGVNLNVGVCTAIQYHGNGANLTGAGSSAYKAQEITATSTSEQIIDLSDGNIIYYKGVATTVGFASTSPAEQITFIRNTAPTFNHAYDISFSTGGVTFDGTGDYLNLANNAAFQMMALDWTMECFWKSGSGNTGNYQQLFGTQTEDTGTTAGIWRVGTRTNSNQIYFSRADGSGFEEPVWNINVNDEEWHHLAFTRESGYIYCWVDGVQQTNVGESNYIPGSMTTSNAFYVGYNTRDGSYITGTVSSLRIVKFDAVYTSGENFIPPSAPLATTGTNTRLLCCQSSTDIDAATVAASAIYGYGDPTAGSQTVAWSGTNTLTNSTSITWPERVKWNGYLPPTLISNNSPYATQLFHFTTADTGATYQAWEEITSDADYGQLWTWGNNQSGGLGINTKNNGYSSPTQVGTDASWMRAKAGDDIGVGIKYPGELFTWGKNERGQLGQNDTVVRSSPTQVGAGKDWVLMDGFHNTYKGGVLATKTNGSLWSWGSNQFGQLGDNSVAHKSSPVQIPGTDWPTSGYKKLNASFGCAHVVKPDGTMWVWGYNQWGGLGLNNNSGDNPGANYSSPTQLGTDTTWKQAAGAGYNVAAIKTDGTLWSWGYTNYGSLGLNQGGVVGRSSPTQIPGSWSDVSCGYHARLALKTDGSLWSWGYNGAGQGGLNNKTSYSSPMQVGTDTTWSKVSAGGGNYVSCAIKTDGTMWAWGQNWWGMLGQNSRTQYSSPVQVPGTWTAGTTGSEASLAGIRN